MQFAKVSAVMSAIIGLIPAVFSLIFLVFTVILMSQSYDWAIFSMMPLFFGVAVPIFTGIAGFIWGLLAGYVYNKIAEHGYGLEIDIEMLPEK